MDDLISREAILNEAKRLSGPITGDGWDNWGVYGLIERQPSVPAVPLDKLCEWLAGNAWHIDCSDCDGEHCDCPQLYDDSGSSPEFWKAKLSKWMEEQNA